MQLIYLLNFFSENVEKSELVSQNFGENQDKIKPNTTGQVQSKHPKIKNSIE